MQEGLRTKLEAVLAAILGGADEAAVRKVWADVCAADVAEAQRRHSAFRRAERQRLITCRRVLRTVV